MDIGDSQFAGVHIPTHEILVKICESHGFKLYQEEILRKRRSKNGMILTQRLLKFHLHKQESEFNIFLAKAKNFIKICHIRKNLFRKKLGTSMAFTLFLPGKIETCYCIFLN